MSVQAQLAVAREGKRAPEATGELEGIGAEERSEHEQLRRERDEARAAAEALRQANRQLTELLQIASHDLRSPLAAIKASEQLAARRLHALRDALRQDPSASVAHTRSAERADDLLTRVDQQLSRLGQLVDDLFDLTRAQTSGVGRAPAPCDLAAVVRQVVAEQRLVWPARSILLAPADGRLAPSPVLADPVRLARVVTNFLANALKYSSEDRPVEVRLLVDGDTARVAVRDEGPGLPAAEHERVWERYHQIADVSHQRETEAGLGLGLYIARGIIAQYGGRVGVHSTPGQGATFWCELPLAVVAEAQVDARH